MLPTLVHVPAHGHIPRAVTLPSLTPHQQDAVTWVVDQIRAGAPLVAIRGLAGVGKSTLIPAVRGALEATGRPVSLGAMTHKAAVVLRQKGLPDAQTLHSLAFTMYFTPAYAACSAVAGWPGRHAPGRRRRGLVCARRGASPDRASPRSSGRCTYPVGALCPARALRGNDHFGE